MTALTVTFQEILGYLKKNLRKVPPIVKRLKCVNNKIFLAIPDKDGPGILIDAKLNFSGQTFKLDLNAEGINSIASLSFNSGELFYFIKKNIRKFPEFLETTEYNEKEWVFHVRGEMEKDAKDIELLAKLFRRLEGGIRLRIAPV
jgi:hypothetical protein